eukprot:19104-Heterococcus_DN1.PRE.2
MKAAIEYSCDMQDIKSYYVDTFRHSCIAYRVYLKKVAPLSYAIALPLHIFKRTTHKCRCTHRVEVRNAVPPAQYSQRDKQELTEALKCNT